MIIIAANERHCRHFFSVLRILIKSRPATLKKNSDDNRAIELSKKDVI